MTQKKTSLVIGEAKKILKEFEGVLMLKVDPIKEEQLAVFLGHRLLGMYHEGFLDGMSKARDIITRKEGGA